MCVFETVCVCERESLSLCVLVSPQPITGRDSGLLVQFVFKEQLMALEADVICTCNEMERPPRIPWRGGVSSFSCLSHLALSCLYNSIVSIILSSWLKVTRGKRGNKWALRTI